MYKFVKRLRSRLLVFLTHRMALPFLQKIRKPEFFPYTEESLRQFAPGTLGHDLVHFIHSRQLQLLPYYAKHDIKHILLQYDTTDEGEVCLQCFMLGNGHISFPVAATVLYGLVTMPEYWRKFRRAYVRGKKSMVISKWPWHLLVNESTVTLRDRINSNQKNKIYETGMV